MEYQLNSGVINVVARTVTSQAVADAIAHQLAAFSVGSNGAYSGGLAGYWQAKCSAALSAGTLLSMHVNDGGVSGAVVIERDLQDLAHGIVLAAVSAWDAETYTPKLRAVAAAEGARLNIRLSELSHTRTPLSPGQAVVDPYGNAIASAVAVVTTTQIPFACGPGGDGITPLGGAGGGPFEPLGGGGGGQTNG